MKRIAIFSLTWTAVWAASCSGSCSELKQSLGGHVSFPGQTGYASTQRSFWSMQESALAPSCVVHPLSAQDVAFTLKTVTHDAGCLLAIKSQGHAPAAGFANVDNGVTIDLTTLDSIQLSPDHSVVSVGAGARWLDVYAYLDSFNLAVAGGRNGLVGVGGLLVGGGISHFTARVGWACDNIVNFEVVLSNGVVTNANNTHQADLFRALKGGANNFGVVTRFDLATFPQGDISVTDTVNPVSERESVFQAFTDIASSDHFDTSTSLVTQLLYNSTAKSWLITNTAVYTKPVLHPTVYSDLASVPSISNSSKITRLSTLANETATPPLNWLFGTLTFEPSTDLMMNIFDSLNSTIYSVNPTGGVVWSIAFEPLPAVINSYAAKTGGNVLGLEATSESSFVLLVSALWPVSASNDAVYAAARNVISELRFCARSKGMLHKFRYLNYAAPYQKPLASYGVKNLEFMKGVSEKYDPSQTFQSRVRGGFKL